MAGIEQAASQTTMAHHISLKQGGILLALALLVACSSSPEKPVANYPQPAHGNVVNYALSLQGTPYRYGKDSPAEGFDCSGFVRHVYQHHGVRLPRTSQAMASALPPVALDEAHAGDLVFFDTNGKAYSHVGIYLENQQFIHAPSKRTGKVLVSRLNTPYWQKHYSGVRRPQ